MWRKGFVKNGGSDYLFRTAVFYTSLHIIFFNSRNALAAHSASGMAAFVSLPACYSSNSSSRLSPAFSVTRRLFP